MSAPDEPAPAASTNVVPLRAAPSDALAVALRMQDMYRQSCLEVMAVRIEWLASGVACWPDALLSREHILVQLHLLAAGARKMKTDAPAPPRGDAA